MAPASACGPACADAPLNRRAGSGLSGGDGEYVKAVIGEIGGPVLLAGHSYGGSVITAAGTADNVAGLVYISGFAPDEGENLTGLQSKFPAQGPSPTSGSTRCRTAARS